MPSTTMHSNLSLNKTLQHIVILILASAVFFFFRLGSAPLTEPDEGRNAEVAREMLVTGDWCTPHLNFERKLNKPVLLFWASALSMKLAGVKEGAARFPSAAAAAAGVLAVYFLGRRMFGDRAGLLSGLVLASSPLYFAFSRIVIFDMLLAVFITLAMLFFYLGFTEAGQGRKRIFYLLFYASMAFAVLAKGPIGLVIPVAVVSLHLLLTRSTGRFREIEFIPGMLVLLIIASPWYVLMSVKNPEFPRYFFITEHIVRYTTDAFSRTKPFWFYIPVVIGGMFPWILFLPSVIKISWKEIRKNGPNKPALLFLVLWTALVFLFFTFSRSKLAGYILPLLPAVALMLGSFWDAYLKRKKARLFGVFLAVSLLIFGTGLWAWNVYSPERSSRSFAERVLAERRSGDVVVTYESFPTSFLFYMGQQVPIVSDSENFIPGNFSENGPRKRAASAPATIDHAQFGRLLADRRKNIYIVGHRSHGPAISAAVEGKGVRLLLEGRKMCLWVRGESSGPLTLRTFPGTASPRADTAKPPANSLQQ